jgi:integrase
MARKGDAIYKRGNAWCLDFYHDGRRYKVALIRKINRTAAVEIEAIKRAAILKSESGIGRKKRNILFSKTTELFLKAASANTRPNTYRSYKQLLEAMEDMLGGKKLGEISPFLLEKYKQKRMADGAKTSFNREMGTLRTLFNWCIDKSKHEGSNPARKVKRLEESRGRERALTIEEENRLLEECTPTLRTLLMCGIYAGLRIPSEVLNLKWAGIDLARNRLTVLGAFSKTRKTESIPLTSKLRDALADLKRSKGAMQSKPDDYFFTTQAGQPYKSIQNIFRSAAKRAKVAGISPHVCRHTFATRLAEKGVDLRTIQELGRWASLSMVQRYSNISEGHKSEAIEKLSQLAAEESKPADITKRIKRPVKYTKDSASG